MESKINPKIDESWKSVLWNEFQSDYFVALKAFLVKERIQHEVYPRPADIFNAYNSTPFNEVKVVLLGQDPYHGPGQAHGLSFSVQQGVTVPPSLKNMMKELESDVGVLPSNNGQLDNWARQGVLLLNATLTVRHKSPGSHQKKGWETFTDATISALSEQRENIVFFLWGNYARAKRTLIDQHKHLILEAAHPSPFSAHKGFLGCRHFSKANEYLRAHGVEPIDWTLA